MDRQSAHIIERIPPYKLQTPCTIGGDKTVPLSVLIQDTTGTSSTISGKSFQETRCKSNNVIVTFEKCR